ncbi:peptidylprolyl isomerase [Portibacter lacus]|uniref:Periplasmic chaperone PpiD n=1 Tax=Portibacter lacus TaxID=1099794 RepID=A0AA37WGC6_9BACT|nr:SurA N-terminal domain-containing protein [Portibacter lacus]GLR17850.1 peptidylprolyl isomerase [Portibacter lacus]
MALIGKIRQNFWFVLIVLGLALAAFVIMDMTSANRGSAMNPTIGTINGTKINAQEFSRTESILSQNSQIQDANQRRENLWNYFVDKSIVEDETEELGLNVSFEELMDLQFGQNLSPIIQQSFYNPNTGQVDRQQLSQIQNAITTNTGLTPDFKAFWAVQEDQIIANQLQNKLTNLVSKAVYTPSWMVEQEYKQSNTRAQVAYVKIPFDAVSNDAVEVSDSDIKDYMNKNKSMFTSKEETRIVDYISFPVLATSRDSAAIFADMTRRADELANTTSDSIYAVNNGGDKPTLYYALDDLPAQLQDNIGDLELGQTYGPYIDNGVYSAAKVVGRQVIPDSVEARIIVRQALSSNPTQVEDAQDYIDSLRTLIVNGTADFDSLAIQNSQDPSTAQRGGDLGYLTQGMLPSPLDDVLFLEGNIEGLYETKTPQGIFLIQITDVIQRNRDDKFRLAYINTRVTPSQETQDSVLDIVNDFLSENRTLEAITSAAKALNLNVRTSAPLDQNAYQVGNLGSSQSSRDMVRWAFDQSNEEGDVAPDFYSFTDPVDYYTNKYVVVGLRDIVPAGMQTVESAKDELMPLVRNLKKGAKLKAEISGTDLNAIASKYNTSVDTLSAVTMASSSIPAIGNEPEVVAAIFKAGENNVSSPIVGNSGVYVVKPIAIATPGAVSNVGSLRNSTTLVNRAKVGQGLIEGLKKNAKVEDGRFGYGF